jgi:hypothetical protein
MAASEEDRLLFADESVYSFAVKIHRLINSRSRHHGSSSIANPENLEFKIGGPPVAFILLTGAPAELLRKAVGLRKPASI